MLRKLTRRTGGTDRAVVRVLYASDIHGTEVLWRKFLRAPRFYGADGLVMGGDLTGKVAVPLVENGSGRVATLFGREERAGTEAEVAALMDRIRGTGMYPFLASKAEVDRIAALDEEAREAWFEQVILQAFRRWLEIADESLEADPSPCFVMPGNDDPVSLGPLIEQARRVLPCEDRVVELCGLTMISLGYSNPTPWRSPRELEEDELYRRIATLADQVDDLSRCVFNLHVPPHDSGLDSAAEIDDDFNVVLVGKEPHMVPVGSTAVREAIERYQPLASLHGHVHESAGATRIGTTLCLNPGSDYHTGRMAACLLAVRDGTARHQFVAA